MSSSDQKEVTDALTRLTACELLTLSHEQKTRLLGESLHSDSAQIKSAAIRLIAAELIFMPRFVAEIKQLTDDPSATVRAAALRALKYTQSDSLQDIIRDALRDPDKQVRKAAAELFHAKNRVRD